MHRFSMKNISIGSFFGSAFLLGSIAHAADAECPDTSNVESSYDAAAYFSLPKAEDLKVALASEVRACLEEYVTLYRSGDAEGHQLASYISDNSLGAAIMLLVRVPSSEMELSELMTVLSNAQDSTLWYRVLYEISQGRSLNVDEPDPSKQLEWLPEDWDSKFKYAEALRKLTGNHDFWRDALCVNLVPYTAALS